MTSFKIFTRNQSTQILGCKESARVFARLINGPHGWMAHRGAEGSDAVPVNVSRLVNQHDGAAQIAAALGIVG